MLSKIKLFLKERYVLFFEKKTGGFFTSHQRPIFSKGIIRGSKIVKYIDYAVVIQGPITRTWDFTLETVKLYQKIFPNAHIILSTWDDEDPKTIEDFKSIGITVILNRKPAYCGSSNINYQIISTVSGIRKAKELGVTYVFKTRTDQRIYAENTLPFLIGILDKFPVQNSPQKMRLVTTSLGTFIYRPYSISDNFIFGHIDDQLMYWEVPLDDRKFVVPKYMTTLEWAEKRWGEAYFMTHFIKKINGKVDMTLADTWYAYKNFFCVIDQQDIDLFWLKYKRHREYRRLRYDGTFLDKEMTFKDWLLLYDNIYTIDEAASIPINQEFASQINTQ